MEGLRAGIAEMRSVAQRLMKWAEDLEASMNSPDAPDEKPETGEPAPKAKKAGARQKNAAEEKPVLTLPEVRAVLAEKCAEGFGTQVKALIESYGAASLKDVPADRYEELLETVKGLGDADAG